MNESRFQAAVVYNKKNINQADYISSIKEVCNRFHVELEIKELKKPGKPDALMFVFSTEFSTYLVEVFYWLGAMVMPVLCPREQDYEECNAYMIDQMAKEDNGFTDDE